jgi:hypothetical protein
VAWSCGNKAELQLFSSKKAYGKEKNVQLSALHYGMCFGTPPPPNLFGFPFN